MNIHAGSGMTEKECAKCSAEFDAHPELLDAEEALRWLRVSVDIDQLRAPWLADYLVGIGRRAGVLPEVVAVLEAHVDDEAEIDERVVAIERALRKARKLLEGDDG